MAWWLRPCGPGAGSGQAQDVQNSPARPVLADGECYARRTQRPHSCEQRSGRSHPPTTAPQHYARSAQSHDRSIVRLLNRGSCSGRALLAAARSSCFRVKAGECADFAARLRRSARRCSRLCRTVLGRCSERLSDETRPDTFTCQFSHEQPVITGSERLATRPRCSLLVICSTASRPSSTANVVGGRSFAFRFARPA